MNSKTLTVGLDLGDRKHHACVLDAAGAIIEEEAMTNTRESIARFAQRFAGSTFIMETGTHSPWVSRLIESQGQRVLVANARKLRAISQSHTKSDAEDARMLARLGRADPALLCPVKHRSERGQRALLRIKVREALVRSRVNQMNSVRFLLKSLGVPVVSGSKAMTFTRRLRPVLDEATCGLVEPLLSMIDALNARIAAMDKELETFGLERFPVTEHLRQVPGVGPLTALAFVLTIEDPARFPDTRDVGAYLGLVPRRSRRKGVMLYHLP